MERDDDSLDEGPRRGAWRELAGFVLENKKWWLIPIVLVLAALGGLLVVAATGAGPFLYTLF